MTAIDPLPFRLGVPGQDVVDAKGVWSISYQTDGLLHRTVSSSSGASFGVREKGSRDAVRFLIREDLNSVFMTLDLIDLPQGTRSSFITIIGVIKECP